jgi:hypothetical protein
MARMLTKRRGKRSKEHPPSPTMLLSKMLPKDLMRSAVLGFLDRPSVASFMEVKEFSQVFRLHECFCKHHGTRLGQVWVPSGPQKQCADCEMLKVGKERCGNCDDFSKRNHFGNCNVCEKSECNDCIFFCEECGKGFCSECSKLSNCEECKTSLCLECENLCVCSECKKTFCDGCKEFEYCVACQTASCSECKETFICEYCWESYCVGCKERRVCEKCDLQVCNDCFCCDESSCLESVIGCNKCDRTLSNDCDNCKKHKFCNLEGAVSQNAFFRSVLTIWRGGDSQC